MTALPAQVDLVEDSLAAYNTCLEFESSARTEHEVTHARVLGYLLLCAPPSGREEVTTAIDSCNRDFDTLSKLGQDFIDFFIRPFKQNKGHTPETSLHPTRPQFDIDVAHPLESIKEAPRSHRTAKEHALIRDGFKCVATGSFDKVAVKILGIEVVRQSGRDAVALECAHIVPDSTYLDLSSPLKEAYSPSVLAVLSRCGYDVDRLKGDRVHSLFNVMTLEGDVHNDFDALQLWFEETDVDNCYQVIRGPQSYLFSLPERVTLTSPDPGRLPLPSKQLLALHAACAKVANLSGTGEYIDELNKDMEDLEVLAHDGGSSDVLTHALLLSTPRFDTAVS